MLARLTFERFLKQIEKLEYGGIVLSAPDGRTYSFAGKHPGAQADIAIHDWRVITDLASKGNIGFAENYRSGLWDSGDLQSLIIFGLQNEQAFQRFVLGGPVARLVSQISYLLKLNTLQGSRRNIRAHYDLGNEFYGLWLDPSMTYSAAIFNEEEQDLEKAQHNKYDRIIQELGKPSGRLLEIGCGWGGFAQRALATGDFDIKGITLSREQHDYARQRLNGAASIALEDYRHQSGQYDHIVSIEMFEAVGEKYWQTYFGKIGELLAQGGKALVQTITIRESDFEAYRRYGDFIRSHIFPGGMLPSRSRFEQEAGRAGLKTLSCFEFGQDYAHTLERWLDNFDARAHDIRKLGFDEGFMRLWRFYLAACAAGFRTGRTDVMQVELSHA